MKEKDKDKKKEDCQPIEFPAIYTPPVPNRAHTEM